MQAESYQPPVGRDIPWFLFSYQSVPQTRNVYKIVGEAIRAERLKAGLSQEQLAEKSNLARNYIGNIERAEKRISLETLVRVAKALNVRLESLVRRVQ
jgi:ribosome-binding protein aMBF1 (putative translation factor)